MKLVLFSTKNFHLYHWNLSLCTDRIYPRSFLSLMNLSLVLFRGYLDYKSGDFLMNILILWQKMIKCKAINLLYACYHPYYLHSPSRFYHLKSWNHSIVNYDLWIKAAFDLFPNLEFQSINQQVHYNSLNYSDLHGSLYLIL